MQRVAIVKIPIELQIAGRIGHAGGGSPSPEKLERVVKVRRSAREHVSRLQSLDIVGGHLLIALCQGHIEAIAPRKGGCHRHD